jgi:hypothetical protein
MRHFLEVFKQYIHRAIAHVVAVVLRPGSVYNSDNFRLWEKHGYHITPLHFYYPIPDTRELEKIDLQKSNLSGIDLRPEGQLALLKENFSKFSQEYNDFPLKSVNSKHFYLENDAFGGIDPYIYYCMIRHFKPKTVVEIGSGYSTLLGAQACRMDNSARYMCIDPWPREFISSGVPGIEFIRQKVEDIDLNLFQQLSRNDILFVDSSHVVRTAGDVRFIILEILPRLEKGVIIHFHDIFLPFDYPKDWIILQHRFWTEQYLLQAYLAENNHIEVLFASHFMVEEYADEVRQTFPNALWIDGGSFWIRKC